LLPGEGARASSPSLRTLHTRQRGREGGTAATFQIGLVEKDNGGSLDELLVVVLELHDERLQVLSRETVVTARAIDDIDEDLGSLNVPQELMTEAPIVASSIDDPCESDEREGLARRPGISAMVMVWWSCGGSEADSRTGTGELTENWITPMFGCRVVKG
jgi:hypothetical protein